MRSIPAQGPARGDYTRRDSIGYPAALLLELMLFHRKVLFERGWMFPWDFRGVHLPLATFVADSIRVGHWPLWDPYTYCGYPIYANIQTALFYPPVFVASLAGAWLGSEALPRLLVIAVVVQLWFAGLCTFALARRLGMAPAAAWIAGTVYTLGCFFVSQAEHMGAMHAATWLPLAWIAVVELENKFRWRWLALLSGALAMTVLAGLPQVAVAAFGSALVLALLLVWRQPKRRVLPLQVLAGWAGALLLAAVQIIPSFELTRHSVAKYRAEWLKSGGGIRWQALPSLFFPNYWNVFDLSKFHGPSDPTFLYLYGSLLGLAFAILAIAWRPDRRTGILAVLTALSAIWMFGDSTPVGRILFQSLPISIRIGIHPEFTLCVFALGFALLAGFGANRLPRRSMQVAAGVLIFADLFAAGSGRPFDTSSLSIEPGVQRDSVDGNHALVARLRELTGAAFPPYRIDMLPDVGYELSSTAPLLRIPMANGCDPMAPERIIQVRLSFAPGARWGTCYQVVNLRSPVVGLANTRYLLSRAPVPDPHFPLAAQVGGMRISENPRSLPRFFFVTHTIYAKDLRDAAVALHRDDFNPADSAIVEGLPPQTATPGRVRVLRYGSNSVALQTSSPGDALLIATDSWYPGWRARIDGQPSTMYIADVAFRAIPVPAGEHLVEMRFVPRILWFSAAISLLALAGFLRMVRLR